MFARQAMMLLEFTSRLAFTDSLGNALYYLSKVLFTIEPKYFTRLPSNCADFDEFDLPYHRSKANELLWALFDLIRNGQAHQYQQILVDLSDNVDWQISLTGAQVWHHLEIVQQFPRPDDYLAYRRDQTGDLWMIVYQIYYFLIYGRQLSNPGS
jgi:hypothetical protein